MASSRRYSVTAAAIAALLACSAISGPANVVEVDVAGAIFDRIGTPAIATVPFSIRNRGATSIFVTRCDTRLTTAVERWDGQGWAGYAADICQAVYTSAPLELAPGVSAAANWSLHDAGKYRIRIGVADAAGSGVNRSLVSSEFEVR
jgi:hypothetical protein